MSRRDRFALLAWLVLFTGFLVGAFLEAMGPGGVYFYAQPPQDRGGLTLPQLDERRHPGCVAPELFPADVVPSRVVAVDSGHDELVTSFARAWRLTHNANRADDLWVIGLCE